MENMLRKHELISLVNVENSLDNNNLPVGHELKMLRDLVKVLGDKTEIMAGREYAQNIKGRVVGLPFCIRQNNPVAAALKVLCNYFTSIIRAKGDVLIYVDTPEALLWGIALFKGKKKIVTITYLQWDRYMKKYIPGSPVRQYLVGRGLNRLDGCIVTNTVYKPHVPYVRIPDYYITDQIRRHQNREKIQGCVCLGEIRAEKDIEGLVGVMRRTSIFLLIAGVFQDKNTYRKVRGLQTPNIQIKNINLHYEMYLQYLSLYKYIILPYNAEYYSLKTSGVLLEGIFLGAVPIAPKSLLEQEKIQGLGYHSVREIPDLIRLYESGRIVVKNDLGRYEFERYREVIHDFLKRVRKEGSQ